MSVTLDHLLEPIADWLDDAAVEEVCIQKPGECWVYSAGEFTRHDVDLDADEIEDIAIVAAAQRRQDISHARPLLATDLVGRGRLQACLYPCVAEGRPSLTIRRGSVRLADAGTAGRRGTVQDDAHVKSTANDDELIALYRAGAWHQFIGEFVRRRKTIIVCGTNASGKTHLLQSGTWRGAAA